MTFNSFFRQGIKSNSAIWPLNDMLEVEWCMNEQMQNDPGLPIPRSPSSLISSTRWRIVGSLSVTNGWRSMSMIYVALPVQGVRVNWTYRFSKKHSEWIKIACSRPLEDKRGRATNPHNNEAWWKLLGDTVEKYKIEEENTYASDEVGIQAQGGGEREYVFGPHTKAAPYQQRSGTRENITTIVTICADGTSTPPAIIFKGSTYQVKWGENNPLNASYVILLIIIFTCVN